MSKRRLLLYISCILFLVFPTVMLLWRAFWLDECPTVPDAHTPPSCRKSSELYALALVLGMFSGGALVLLNLYMWRREREAPPPYSLVQ
jgi:hypothetical protein